MNAQQEIDQQLQDDYDKFYEKKYDGKLPIPERMVEYFKTAIKSMPPQFHKINFNKVKSVSGKKINDLTIGDIHEVIKVIVNTPFEKLMPEVNESEKGYFKAIDNYLKIEKFILEYNGIIEDFQQKLKMRKVTLQELLSPSKRNGNLSIIN